MKLHQAAGSPVLQIHAGTHICHVRTSVLAAPHQCHTLVDPPLMHASAFAALPYVIGIPAVLNLCPVKGCEGQGNSRSVVVGLACTCGKVAPRREYLLGQGMPPFCHGDGLLSHNDVAFAAGVGWCRFLGYTACPFWLTRRCICVCKLSETASRRLVGRHRRRYFAVAHS